MVPQFKNLLPIDRAVTAIRLETLPDCKLSYIKSSETTTNPSLLLELEHPFRRWNKRLGGL